MNMVPKPILSNFACWLTIFLFLHNQCDLHSTSFMEDGMAMVRSWMNDVFVNGGCLATGEGTTEKN